MTSARKVVRSGGGFQGPFPKEIPPGGEPGQFLGKVTRTDYDYGWLNPPAGGGGDSGPVSFPPAFGIIAIPGDASLLAGASPDTLTFVSPFQTVVATTDPNSNTIALEVNVGTVPGTIMAADDARVTNSTLGAIRALTGIIADRLAYFTGAATMALTTFTAFGRSLVAAADKAAARVILGVDLEQIDGDVPTVATRTYVLRENAFYGGTINSIVHDAGSGSCTFSIQINGANVTGMSAIGASTTRTTTNASGANTFAAGARITLVVTANSTCLNFSFSMKITKA